MTPAPIGLTLVSYVELPNLATVSVRHHTLRFVVLLVAVVVAFGFGQLGAIEPTPAATHIRGVA